MFFLLKTFFATLYDVFQFSTEMLPQHKNCGRKLVWPIPSTRPATCPSVTPCALHQHIGNKQHLNWQCLVRWKWSDLIRLTVSVCWNHVSQQFGFLDQLCCLSACCGCSCFLLTSGPLAASQLQKQKLKEKVLQWILVLSFSKNQSFDKQPGFKLKTCFCSWPPAHVEALAIRWKHKWGSPVNASEKIILQLAKSWGVLVVQQGEQLWWENTQLKFESLAAVLVATVGHQWGAVCTRSTSHQHHENLWDRSVNDDSWHWHHLLGAWWFGRASICIGPNWGKPKWKIKS